MINYCRNLLPRLKTKAYPSNRDQTNSSRRKFLKAGVFAGAATTGVLTPVSDSSNNAYAYNYNYKNHFRKIRDTNKRRYFITLRKRFDAMLEQWRQANARARSKH